MNKYDLPNLIGFSFSYDSKLESRLYVNIVEILQYYGCIAKLFWSRNEPVQPGLLIAFRQSLACLSSNGESLYKRVKRLEIARKSNTMTQMALDDLYTEMTDPSLPRLVDSMGNKMFRTLVMEATNWNYDSMSNLILKAKMTPAQCNEQRILCSMLTAQSAWPGKHINTHTIIQYHVEIFNFQLRLGKSNKSDVFLKIYGTDDIQTMHFFPSSTKVSYCVYTDSSSSKYASVDKYSFLVEQFDLLQQTKTNPLRTSKIKHNGLSSNGLSSANAVSRRRLTVQLLKILKMFPYEILFLMMEFHSRHDSKDLRIPPVVTMGPWCDCDCDFKLEEKQNVSVVQQQFQNVKGLDEDSDSENESESEEKSVLSEKKNASSSSSFTQKRKQELQYIVQSDVYLQHVHDHKSILHEAKWPMWARGSDADIHDKSIGHNQFIIRGSPLDDGYLHYKQHNSRVAKNDKMEPGYYSSLGFNFAVRASRVIVSYYPRSIGDLVRYTKSFPATEAGREVKSLFDVIAIRHPEVFRSESWESRDHYVSSYWEHTQQGYEYKFFSRKSVALETK